ncbi:MAG: toll/interleukin-1 receptor domain-containing protein [Candidatus Methylumidiphilus sp.]
MRIFISYSHKQGQWVWERLVPVLKAGGAEVLIDRKHFQIGKAVVGQMDALQAQAERHLLVFSPDYLASLYCRHEMQNALALDPTFTHHLIVPVIREACALPKSFLGKTPSAGKNPIYADLQDDSNAAVWDKLLQACEATSLGARATDWLAARDDIRKYLERNQSVNLVVNGDGVNWRGLLEHLATDCLPDLARVDLQHPDTTSREGLLSAIAKAMNATAKIPPKPHDLAEFNRLFTGRFAPVRLCLSHFDLAAHRDYYDVDLFSTLRYLNMETRQLVLVIQSRCSFASLLPMGSPLSVLDVKTIQLNG